jgi:hypothetical protein
MEMECVIVLRFSLTLTWEMICECFFFPNWTGCVQLVTHNELMVNWIYESEILWWSVLFFTDIIQETIEKGIAISNKTSSASTVERNWRQPIWSYKYRMLLSVFTVLSVFSREVFEKWFVVSIQTGCVTIVACHEVRSRFKLYKWNEMRWKKDGDCLTLFSDSDLLRKHWRMYGLFKLDRLCTTLNL